ncbi:carbonic anhydrase family protein [Roseibacillus persicicus]|uniref:Carbonic anhydrase n=1 Tax=Roseibacillus persicicus TaxID=454148 RepID=A0A918WPH4_9BACT|nr:carbonic anhydrase family protein [Roseibacillus persicicus]GHC62158.1 carbonic anhydrase [Roseibacillus persicicus]
MKYSNLAIAAALLTSSIAFAEEAKVAPTAETQKSLTPESVMADLMAGNKDYVAGKSIDPNIEVRREAGTAGQFPKAYILSCVDSRVPVEQVFNQGIGDLFVGRVAGNIETDEQLGSMEFAAVVGGVKVIMVLGHEACGAVKGACDHVKMGNLTTLLDQITPAIDKVEGHEDDRSSKNEEFVADVVEKNVVLTVDDIRERSKVLADLEKEGKIKIVGGVYSLHTGAVTLQE